MTLRTGSVIEAETYDTAITALGLEPVFAEVTGTQLTEFTLDNTDLLPVSLLSDVLDNAPGEYLLDTPETGNAPRYRVIELADTVNGGDVDGA